jgi:hypothetical protein
MSLERRVSGYSSVVATKNQVSSDLGGEAVILDLKSGVYYGLNDVGTRIWHLIQEPKTLNEIQDAILEEYEVEPNCCAEELLTLLQELLAVGLIEVSDETAG